MSKETIEALFEVGKDGNTISLHTTSADYTESMFDSHILATEATCC